MWIVCKVKETWIQVQTTLVLIRIWKWWLLDDYPHVNVEIVWKDCCHSINDCKLYYIMTYWNSNCIALFSLPLNFKCCNWRKKRLFIGQNTELVLLYKNACLHIILSIKKKLWWILVWKFLLILHIHQNYQYFVIICFDLDLFLICLKI